MQKTHTKTRSNTLIYVLICCVFIVGIFIAFVLLSGRNAGDSTESPQNYSPNNNQYAIPGENSGNGVSAPSSENGSKRGSLNVITKEDGDGNLSYSTDGGRTWGNTPPDGFNEKPGTDGKK